MNYTALRQEPAIDGLAAVQTLYDRGRYLAALEAGRELGPLTEWAGPAGRVMAGRLASNLGAGRLGRQLHRLAFRESPDDPLAIYYYGCGLRTRKGAWHAWKFLSRYGNLEAAPGDVQANWAALCATVLACLGDFERADSWLQRAERICPSERAWVLVEKAFVLERQDEYDAAVAAALESLRIEPFFRPAVQAAGYLLVQLNHDDEALLLLQEASEQLESGFVITQLAALQTELGDYEQARMNYERAEQFFPLLSYDRTTARWFASRRSDAAYLCSDLEAAVNWAERVNNPFFDTIAAHLADEKRDGRRVMLPVGFVRQHQDTCAPATLAVLSEFWSRAADHCEVAEAICYDGTPRYRERLWAEQNGFTVREFRVTWESTVALIDRGIPFTLTTVEPGAGHLQAVIGYDSRRGTLLVRDPSERHHCEFVAERLFERQASSGPRGMALVPDDQSHLLVDLPEAGFYDLGFQLETALRNHERSAAEEAYQQLVARDPDARLTIEARGYLAGYDGDNAAGLACVEQLAERYPDDPNLLSAKLRYLNDFNSRKDRLQILEKLTADPDTDVFVWLRLAYELEDDAREQPRLERLLLRCLKHRASDGEALALLANLRWRQLQRDEALELYRFAACANNKTESFARSFFTASRQCGQTDEALRMLRDRWKRFCKRSVWPAQTLAWALEQISQIEEAFEILEEALAIHPQDQDLLLHLADMYARFGQEERGEQALQRARAHCHPSRWSRTAAGMASYRGDFDQALQCWQDLLSAEPFAIDGHEAVARLLADMQGEAAAIEHMRQAVERFPHHRDLHASLIEWLRNDAAAAEAAVREFLQQHPADPWAQRELAICLGNQSRADEAIEAAQLACRLDPSSPVGHAILAGTLAAKGSRAEAMEACRKAIRLSVDYDQSIHRLLELCETKEERVQELEFVITQLAEQNIEGHSLPTIRDLATATLDADRVLQILRDLLRDRSDLWQVWSALTEQLVSMDRFDEAHDVARDAVNQFAWLPRLWLNLANVCRTRDDSTGALEALQRALQINSHFTVALRELAEIYTEQGNTAEARELLERCISVEPRDVRNHGMLANLLWNEGAREQAVKHVVHAVQLDADYPWGWRALRCWGEELGQPNLETDTARQLTERRAEDGASWYILASSLERQGDHDGSLAAIDEAIARRPRYDDAHSMRAWLLATLGRFDEALTACRPDAYGAEPPLQLEARRAEVLYKMDKANDAIAVMRDVVEADPDYYWAWNQLADWYEATERHQEQLRACRQMVRLAPRHGIALGYLADAEISVEDTAAAKSHLRQAMDLDPEYQFAVTTLINLHLADREWEAASEVWQSGQAALPEDVRLAFQLKIAAARGRQQESFELLIQLCQMSMTSDAPLGIAARAMGHAEWLTEMETLLLKQLRSAEKDRKPISPYVGGIFTEVSLYNRGTAGCAAQLAKFAGCGEAWIRASCDLLEAPEALKDAPRLLAFIRKHRRRLKRDNRTWAAAGEALSSLREHKQVIHWLSDWKKREDLQPYMLLPLVTNLWYLRKPARASHVSRHAVTLPADHTTALHQVWFALDEVLNGSRAAEVLQQVRLDRDTADFYPALVKLLETMVQNQEQRSTLSYRDASQRLRDTHREVGDDSPFLQRIFVLCLQRLARTYRRPLASLWYGHLATKS